MFFQNPTPEYKKDSPVDIVSFIVSGEHDQGDKAIVSYDDIFDILYDENRRNEIIKKIRDAYNRPPPSA